MRQIFIFTAGDKEARKHLDDSITKPVSSDLLDEFLPSNEATYIKSLLEEPDNFYAWGAVPGIRNKPTWEAMQVGDFVLTVFDNHYRFFSTVIAKLHSKDLAKRIWGLDADNQTWEFMYLLSKPQQINEHILTPPAADLLNKAYRGYTRISDSKVQQVVEKYKTLDSFFSTVFKASTPLDTIDRALQDAESTADTENEFNPDNQTDGRKKVVAEIIRRRGQPKFRKALLEAYEGRCAVTDCDIEEVLEAAHIAPYKGSHTNSVNNGILLRADIHTLFDIGRIKIDEQAVIHVHDSLIGSIYEIYQGKKAQLPSAQSKAPNTEALKRKFTEVL